MLNRPDNPDPSDSDASSGDDLPPLPSGDDLEALPIVGDSSIEDLPPLDDDILEEIPLAAEYHPSFYKTGWAFPEPARPLLSLTEQDLINANVSYNLASDVIYGSFGHQLFKKKAFLGRLILIVKWLWDKEQEHLMKFGGRDNKKKPRKFYGQISDCNQLVLSNHNVHLHYSILKELGYIEWEPHQRPDRKVKPFRLTEPYRSSDTFYLNITEYISDRRAWPNIRRWIDPFSEVQRETWSSTDQWLWACIKKFEINDKVLELLYTQHESFITKDQKQHLIQTYLKFKNNNQVYLPCRKGLGEGRVYSTIVGMNKKARRYLTIDDEDGLGQIDIVAAQPYFATSKFNQLDADNINAQKEIAKWWQLYKMGDFYTGIHEYLTGEVLEEKKRDSFKTAFCSVCISAHPFKHFKKYEDSKWDLYRDSMQEKFPHISELFDLCRNVDKPVEIVDDFTGFDIQPRDLVFDYKAFSKELRNLESKIMVKGVCSDIMQNGAYIVATVHDCLIVPYEFVNHAEKVIKKHCEQIIGEPPKLKVEYLGFTETDQESITDKDKIKEIESAIKSLKKDINKINKKT